MKIETIYEIINYWLAQYNPDLVNTNYLITENEGVFICDLPGRISEYTNSSAKDIAEYFKEHAPLKIKVRYNYDLEIAG